ncbi:conserved protein, unknown function [Hepatocystis sp. ex Piliocolobus tephrosceles]|nr:conserved protein, unknown function [Hepatocystis sp. ex Piliocolobus tephrosceles]
MMLSLNVFNKLRKSKKIVNIHLNCIKTSSKLYNNEDFIFNFENIEKLKKIKEETNQLVVSNASKTCYSNKVCNGVITNVHNNVSNNVHNNVSNNVHNNVSNNVHNNVSNNVHNNVSNNVSSDVGHINTYEIDKSKLKKTKSVLAIIKKKLKNNDNSPINKYFFILYKNVSYLSSVEVINILYHAIKNKKYNSVKTINYKNGDFFININITCDELMHDNIKCNDVVDIYTSKDKYINTEDYSRNNYNTNNQTCINYIKEDYNAKNHTDTNEGYHTNEGYQTNEENYNIRNNDINYKNFNAIKLNTNKPKKKKEKKKNIHNINIINIDEKNNDTITMYDYNTDSCKNSYFLNRKRNSNIVNVKERGEVVKDKIKQDHRHELVESKSLDEKSSLYESKSLDEISRFDERSRLNQPNKKFDTKQTDYIYRLLSKFLETTKERNEALSNISLEHISKLSYCLSYYKLNYNNNNSFISLYLCSFLKKEINKINEKKNEHYIKDNTTLDILLQTIAREKTNLNIFFFYILDTYLFSILKNNLFYLSCKNICSLLYINNFKKYKYDYFFFFSYLLSTNKQKKIPPTPKQITLLDINYLLFYQIKNNIIFPDKFFHYDLFDQLLVHSQNINLQIIKNIQLLSTFLLNYNYSKLCASITGLDEKYMEIIYNIYSYIFSKVHILIKNEKLKEDDCVSSQVSNQISDEMENSTNQQVQNCINELEMEQEQEQEQEQEHFTNVQIIITFSLTLYIIRNNLQLNNDFFFYLFYLLNNTKNILTVQDYLLLLNFIYYCNYVNETNYSKNKLLLSMEQEKKGNNFLYIYSNLKNDKKTEYISFDNDLLVAHIFNNIKKLYSYNGIKKKKNTQITTFLAYQNEPNKLDEINEFMRGKKSSNTAYLFDKNSKTNDQVGLLSNGFGLKQVKVDGNQGETALITEVGTVQAISNQAISNQAISNQTISNQAISNQAISNQAISNQTTITQTNHVTRSFKKKHYLIILDILLSLNNYNNKEEDLYKHLLNLFQKNIFKYNIHLFDIDKILFSYTLLNIKPGNISLKIFNLLEKIKTNIILNYENNSIINKESYFLHSFCSILLSCIELNLLNVINLDVFEKYILKNINKININSILILLQYYILKSSQTNNMNINIITFLVLNYIEKKYNTGKKLSDIRWDKQSNTTILNKLKNDKNYTFMKRYIQERSGTIAVTQDGDNNNCYKFNLQQSHIQNNYNLSFFKKIDEDDLYEFLLLRFVFLYIATHSDLFINHFKNYYLCEEKQKNGINNFNKIILHLKTEFTEALNWDIPNMPNMPNIPNISNMPNIPNIPNMPNIPNIPNIPNMYEQNRLNKSKECYKNVETYFNLPSHCINDNIKEKYNFLTKEQFILLLNYFHFILKYSVNFIMEDKNFLTSMSMQHVFVKKYKCLYYNYKYSFIYRKFLLSIIYNMKKKNILTVNKNLICKKNKNSTSQKEKMNINEYMRVIKLFNDLCVEKGKKKNTFYYYLKESGIEICSRDSDNNNNCKVQREYTILHNESLIYNLINHPIENVFINVPFFNYFIPMFIKTKNICVAVQIIFNGCENLNLCQILFDVMKSFLKNYNYDVILIKKNKPE